MQVEPSWFASLAIGIATALFGFKLNKAASDQKEIVEKLTSVREDVISLAIFMTKTRLK